MYENRIAKVRACIFGWIALTAIGSAEATSWMWQYPGHDNGSQCAEFSPDGRTMASGGSDMDRCVRIWDVASRRLIRTLVGQIAQVNAVAFSPDGALLASGAGDFSSHLDPVVRMWNPQTGVLVRSFPGHSGTVTAIAFTDDGRSLVCAETTGRIKIWDVETGLLRTELTGHTSAVRSMALRPNRRELITCGFDQTIRGWNTNTWTQTFVKNTSGMYPRAIALFANEDLCAVAYTDTNIRIHDLASWAVVRTLEGHLNYITDVAVSMSGQRLASSGYDGVTKIWDAQQGIELYSLSASLGTDYGVTFLPSDESIVISSTSDDLSVYNAYTGATSRAFSGTKWQPSSADSNADGSQILFSNGYAVQRWTSRLGELLVSQPVDVDAFGSLACSPDGMRFVVEKNNGISFRRFSDCIEERWRGMVGGPGTLGYSHDGTKVIAGDSQGKIGVWEATTGVPRLFLTGASSYIHVVRFSPNGQYFLSAADNLLKLWNAQTGALIRTYSGHSNVVRSAVFNELGDRIYSTGQDGTIKCWDTASGQILFSVPTINGIMGTDLQFSPRRQQLITEEWPVITYRNLQSGEIEARIEGNMWGRVADELPDGSGLVLVGTTSGVIRAPQSLTGTITLDGYLGTTLGHSALIAVLQGGVVTQQVDASLCTDWTYGISPAEVGVAELVFTFRTGLKKAVLVDLEDLPIHGLDVTLTNGDCDGDNEIGPSDFSVVVAAFGSAYGESGFLDSADLDGDGEVGPGDFGIVSSNFGQTGD